MAAVINEAVGPYHAYNGTGKWNAYDIKFRAARFKDGKLTEKALVSMYFNGIKAPSRRRVRPILMADRPLPGPILVALDIHHIQPV